MDSFECNKFQVFPENLFVNISMLSSLEIQKYVQDSKIFYIWNEIGN